MWERAYEINQSNILLAAGHDANARFLDLGCWDGEWTTQVARSIGTSDVNGVEIVEFAAAKARSVGVSVLSGDLGKSLNLPDDSFDVVHANQVIEHVPDVDVFMSEIVRVLKPGGRAIISTENGSSWCNVFAAAMGWQIFSSTNLTTAIGGVGNPFALHKSATNIEPSMRHKTIFNYCGLVEFVTAHGLTDVRRYGAGLFPFPARFGQLDIRHSHFITVCAFKKQRARSS